MDPQVQQDGPGKCPLCGMDLIPLADMPDGEGERVSLSERAAALARIQTAEVVRIETPSVDLRLLGFAMNDQAISTLAVSARRWLIAALVVMLGTGVLLFLSEAIKCFYNTAFWVKIITLPFNITIGTAKQLMERYSYDTPQQVYLINRNKQYRGTVNYFDILRGDPDTRLKTLVIEAVTVLDSKMMLPEAVEALEHSTLPALPVTDADQTLIGEVDWQFALSTQREIYEARLMAGTGMDEGDDLFAPVLKSSQKRGVWLGINLLTAILASVTIGLFEDVIAQVVALAVLMPIVASMGGIAGSQTLTLMIRAMALNQITPGNRFKLLKNELGIGSLNGIAWALIIGGLAGLWFQSPVLGGTIALAIIVNIITAALFGVLIPIILDKFKLDPALAGSVILTTVTDVVGFFAFLGTASLVML